MASAEDVTIPQPLSSGAVDRPDVVQHGVPAANHGLPEGAVIGPSLQTPHKIQGNGLPEGAVVGPALTPPPAAGAPKAPAYEPIPGILPRIVGEATEAYHHPWEAAKGAAKGIADVAGAVIPGVQSESIDPNDPNFKNNPYISQRVKGLLSTEPAQTPRDLSGGVVSGIMQPQNTAQQGGYDVAQLYGAARGAHEMGKGAAGVIEAVRPGTLPKIMRPAVPQPERIALTRPADVAPPVETARYHEEEAAKTTSLKRCAEDC